MTVLRNELDAAHNLGVNRCFVLWYSFHGIWLFSIQLLVSISAMHLDLHVQKFNLFWLFLLLIPLKLMSFCHWSIHVCTSLLGYGVDCASLVFGCVGGNPLVGVTKALPFW